MSSLVFDFLHTDRLGSTHGERLLFILYYGQHIITGSEIIHYCLGHNLLTQKDICFLVQSLPPGRLFDMFEKAVKEMSPHLFCYSFKGDQMMTVYKNQFRPISPDDAEVKQDDAEVKPETMLERLHL